MPGPGRPFKKGEGGRPKGAVSGRTKALQALDALLKDPANVEKLEAAWQKALDTNALGFWKKIVEPLLPKNATLEVSGSVSVHEVIREAARQINAAAGDQEGAE